MSMKQYENRRAWKNRQARRNRNQTQLESSQMEMKPGDRVSFNAPGLKGNGVIQSIRVRAWQNIKLIRIKRENNEQEIELPATCVKLDTTTNQD